MLPTNFALKVWYNRDHSYKAGRPLTLRQRWFALGSGFLLFAVTGAVVSFWLLASLTRPLARLRNTALALAAGDLQQRIPTLGRDEIDEVAQAFNLL